ncbi:hypothetical protein [Methylomonas lenta]|uniref:hypothetical protein n=1 Tax=Methylomonas lenta TaxID=980561 RepID=UPI0012F6C34E|nr:hypothetical protein [Methylomonas lenta]
MRFNEKLSAINYLRHSQYHPQEKRSETGSNTTETAAGIDNFAITASGNPMSAAESGTLLLLGIGLAGSAWFRLEKNAHHNHHQEYSVIIRQVIIILALQSTQYLYLPYLTISSSCK